MRVNYVLIDFESVQPATLTLLEPEHFRVIVFVGASQAKIPFELANALQRMGERARYIKISGHGHNALDFHIAYHIGRLVGECKDAFFHVISKDTGFDPLLQHMKEQGVLAARCAGVEDIPIVRANKAQSPGERAAIFIERLSRPHASKPRTEKTLARHISAAFQNLLTDDEVGAAIATMQSASFIELTEGKVTYPSLEQS